MALKSFIFYWTVRPKYKIITWFTICYLFTINVKEYNFLKSNYVKMLLINGISCPQTAPFATAYSLFDLMTSDTELQKQCAKCMYKIG